MSDTVEYVAQCTSCPARYVTSEMASKRKMVTAKVNNRAVWMQHHTDMTGHPRFEITDIRARHVICRRSSDTDPQLVLADDPNHSLIRLGPTPALDAE